MLPKSTDNETLIPLLPFGETLRPLILASSLKGTDLKFVLQRRGIFVGSHRNDVVVPILTSILLSPQEFEILKNRQRLKDNAPKTSDAKVEWGSTKTIAQAVPDEFENFVRNLVSEDESYSLTNCTVTTINSDNVIVDCTIERLDCSSSQSEIG